MPQPILYQVRGTDIKGGMLRSVGKEFSPVVFMRFGEHEDGTRYADVTLENGTVERCWEQFLYLVA